MSSTEYKVAAGLCLVMIVGLVAVALAGAMGKFSDDDSGWRFATRKYGGHSYVVYTYVTHDPDCRCNLVEAK